MVGLLNVYLNNLMIVLNNRNLNRYEVPGNARELNLAYNNLQTLVQVTENLMVLDLSHNKIAMIDGVAERNSLCELNLSYNRLISIEGICALNKLQAVDISYNFLSPNQLIYLTKLKNLRVLNVSHNHFATEDALIFLNNLTQLNELNLSFNEFQSWGVKQPMPNLQKLILDNNKIKTLNLQNLPNLEILSCTENSLVEIYGLTSLLHLCQLFIDFNELYELPPLTNIEVLSVSHNKLNFLPVFPNIQMLNVSFNLLNNIPKISPNIVQLIVSSNCLTTLPAGMKNLEVLDVSNNKLSSLDFLTGCELLSILNLAYNEFQSPESILPALKNCPLTDLDLSGLPLNKDHFSKILHFFPDLEKLNEHLISLEDKQKVLNSREISFLANEEPARHVNPLEIPDLAKIIKLKLDPNSSQELTGKKPSLSEYNSPRSVCLTPSHTETFSIIPVSSTPKPGSIPINSPKAAQLSCKMNEMYRSIVSSMKKNISKQFSEFAQEHEIPHKHHHHHRHCKRHICRQKSNNRSPSKFNTIPKTDESNPLKFTFNEKDILNNQGLHISYSPIPVVNRKNEEFIVKGIVKYAKIPPRPVLRHEKNKRIEAEVVNGSQEFLLIGSFFAQKGVRVSRVLKIFKLGKLAGQEFDEVFMCYAADGWEESDGVEELLNSRIKVGKKVLGMNGTVLVCVGEEGAEKNFSGEAGWVDKGLLAPVYLVWYAG